MTEGGGVKLVGCLHDNLMAQGIASRDNHAFGLSRPRVNSYNKHLALLTACSPQNNPISIYSASAITDPR